MPQYQHQLLEGKAGTVCDQGLGRDAIYEHARGNHSILCKLHGAERNFESLPATETRRIYTIIRDPVKHTLSQYYHCTDHRLKAHYMPSTFDKWIHAWAAEVDNKNSTINPSKLKKFHCYNPVNHQAEWTQFDAEQGKEGLKRKFTVLGNVEQMDKSICAILIAFTRGWVPAVCDCTDVPPEDRQLLDLAYDPKRDSHGVTVHASNQNITQEQEKLVLETLRPKDVKLYHLGRQVFEEQVQELEQEFGIRVCSKFRLERLDI